MKKIYMVFTLTIVFLMSACVPNADDTSLPTPTVAPTKEAVEKAPSISIKPTEKAVEDDNNELEVYEAWEDSTGNPLYGFNPELTEKINHDLIYDISGMESDLYMPQVFHGKWEFVKMTEAYRYPRMNGEKLIGQTMIMLDESIEYNGRGVSGNAKDLYEVYVNFNDTEDTENPYMNTAGRYLPNNYKMGLTDKLFTLMRLTREASDKLFGEDYDFRPAYFYIKDVNTLLCFAEGNLYEMKRVSGVNLRRSTNQ